MTNEKLLDDIRTLGLEVKKVELENQLAQLKAEQAIDEGLETIVKKQNQILLHIKAELEFIKQHPFDMVLVGGSIENMSRVIEGQTEPIIDEGCVGCCEVVDVAAKLQEELDAVKSDRDIMFQNYRNTIAKLQDDIKGLEAELSARKEDSKVLMKVVELTRDWLDTPMPDRSAMNRIEYLVKDYLDAPEVPPETPIDEKQEITITFEFLELP